MASMARGGNVRLIVWDVVPDNKRFVFGAPVEGAHQPITSAMEQVMEHRSKCGQLEPFQANALVSTW